MNLASEDQARLRELITEGVTKGAQRLRKLSGSYWSFNLRALKTGSINEIASGLMPPQEGEVYSAYYSIPNGAFLAVFSRASAAGLVNAFIGPFTERMLKIQDVEPSALGEAAGIMVNAVGNSIADACGISFIVSAPKVTLGPQNAVLKDASEKFSAVGPEGESFFVYSGVSMAAPLLDSECSLIILLRRELLEALLAKSV